MNLSDPEELIPHMRGRDDDVRRVATALAKTVDERLYVPLGVAVNVQRLFDDPKVRDTSQVMEMRSEENDTIDGMANGSSLYDKEGHLQDLVPIYEVVNKCIIDVSVYAAYEKRTWMKVPACVQYLAQTSLPSGMYVSMPLTRGSDHFVRQTIRIRSLRHLLIIAGKFVNDRFYDLSNRDVEKVNEYKILIHEHMGAVDDEEGGLGFDCDCLPVQSRDPYMSIQSNMCVSCGVAGVCSLGCINSESKHHETTVSRTRRRNSVHAVAPNLCFQCFMLTRIQSTNFIKRSDRHDLGLLRICSCSEDRVFSRLMLLTGLSYNHGLFAPLMLEKAVKDTLIQAFAEACIDNRVGQPSWSKMQWSSTLTRMLMNHFSQCKSQTSRWMREITDKMGDISDEKFATFLDKAMRGGEIEKRRDGEMYCSFCETQPTYEIMFRLSEGHLPYIRRSVVTKGENRRKTGTSVK
eukprot:Seg3562.4 transcript_id=Seg3562.4/GoldUCD/mRNA.D3Y31 product="hypothetical protein" protein_id=Seg3562.4/GoldUCD/D3Y31